MDTVTAPTSPRYLGALDQSTTSTRFILFSRDGRIAASAQQEHAQIMPAPGLVEHDALEIWQRTVAVIDAAVARAGITAADVAAIGITNQRETTLLWNRHTGEPVHNALVWQDTRVAPKIARLRESGGIDRFRAQTGLPLSTYFSALKLAWLLDHVTNARAQAEAGDLLFGTIDTWLVWKLTGRHLTDVTNASRTQLMHIETLTWDDALLAAFNIPRSVLPEIRSSSEHFGDLRSTALAGVPIMGILGDQQAALVGQTCFTPGEAKSTYGTGCFLLMNTGPLRHSWHGLVSTVAYKFGDAPAAYALEGSIAIAGALVQWLRDSLNLIDDSDEIEALAATVPDNGGVYMVPAFSGLYAPHWNDSARGLIAGITRYAHKGHLARAVLEATAFQTREVVEAMEADAGVPLAQLRCDGGMVVNDLLMQFQADILGRSVVRPAITEITALGAAYAAGLACGFFSNLDELREHWAVSRTWQPSMQEKERERLYHYWQKAVSRSVDWIDR